MDFTVFCVVVVNNLWTLVFFVILATGPPLAAHARSSGLKKHSRREEAFKEENFSKIILFNILKFFEFILGSWGVHWYPWFQNLSINMARAEVHRRTDILCMRFTI